MKPESDGGRHGPFNEGYCPHLVAEGKTEWLGVRVVHCPDLVHPGEEKELEFELMYARSVDYSALARGRAFSILEGAKIVGTGMVLG
jgi:translation elongation factor EF-Tu-like GTPase